MSKDKRSAAQKIADLENALMSTFQTMENMARDLILSKEALTLLGSKMDAIATLLENGEAVNSEAISKLMVANKVEKMKSDTAALEAQGVITSTEEVASNSFVVGRDLAADGSGTVVNPRLQFTFANIPDAESQGKILGKRVGDVIDFGENRNKLEITEIYRIGQEAPEAPEEVQASEDVGPAFG